MNDMMKITPSINQITVTCKDLRGVPKTRKLTQTDANLFFSIFFQNFFKFFSNFLVKSQTDANLFFSIFFQFFFSVFGRDAN